MKMRGLFGGLIAIIGFQSSPAVSCSFKQTFFSNSSEGTLAYLKDAENISEARTVYSGWCEVGAGTPISLPRVPSLYFGLNNRLDRSSGEYSFYVVKVFRRSRATELRPLLSLFRNGSWMQSGCPLPLASGAFKRVSFGTAGRGVVSAFLDRVRENALRPQCDDFGTWLGKAHGNPSLALSTADAFLLDTPQRVVRTGAEKWSLNVSAFAYKTVSMISRREDFPILMVTRDNADEMVVQYMSNSSKWHEFYIH